MQTSLFQLPSLIQQPQNQQNEIAEDKIIQPLTQILEEVTPKPVNQHSQQINKSRDVKYSLDELFPEQQYVEKNTKKAKDILGSTADAFTEEQFRDTVAEIQFLTESWLDEFERETFKGLTLKELLHERGGA